MQEESLPQEVENLLHGESRDFAIKAKRKVPLKKALSALGIGIFWLAFTSIFFFLFLGPVLIGSEAKFELNGKPVVASQNNLGPLIVPALVIGFFILIGIGITAHGLYLLFSEGPWFIGTDKRLVIFNKNKTRSINWEQFNGNIEISGSEENGSIELQLRTGHMSKRRNRGRSYGNTITIKGIPIGLGQPQDQYTQAGFVPDMIYMVEIANAYEVEKILRKRMDEHDPTPSIEL